MAVSFKQTLRKDSKRKRRSMSFEEIGKSEEFVQEFLNLINDFIKNTLDEGREVEQILEEGAEEMLEEEEKIELLPMRELESEFNEISNTTVQPRKMKKK